MKTLNFNKYFIRGINLAENNYKNLSKCSKIDKKYLKYSNVKIQTQLEF